MNIVLVSSMYASSVGGGAEQVVQSQAEGLAARGHKVHVLTLGEPGTATEHTSMNGVGVIRVAINNLYLPRSADPDPWTRVAWHARDVCNVRMARAAREQLALLRPDAVVCHNVYGWSASVLPAIKSLGLPLVQVLHDHYMRCIRSGMYTTRRCTTPCVSCQVMRLPHRRLSRLPDAVVGVSRYIMDSLTEAGYFRGVRIRTVMHNASNVDTRSRPTPPRTDAAIVFGFIGSLSHAKGIGSLLAAFRATALPHWRLLVAGTGEPRYVEQLKADHADPRIEFLGRQEPATFYLRLDATVVPSLLNEALGNVVFESLVHGRPVLGSRRGGIPEMLADGETGLLFDPETEGDLASALQRFADDVDVWRARHAAIKSIAAPRYCDIDAWISRWESLLKEVSGAGNAGCSS